MGISSLDEADIIIMFIDGKTLSHLIRIRTLCKKQKASCNMRRRFLEKDMDIV
jgi:hypothetical protein